MISREIDGDSSESARLLQEDEQQAADNIPARENAARIPFGEGEFFDGVLVPFNVLQIIASHLSDDWKAMLAFFHVTKKIQHKLFNNYNRLVAPLNEENESVPINVNLRYENGEIITVPFRNVNYVLQCYQHLTPALNQLTARRRELSNYMARQEERAERCNQVCSTVGCIAGVAAWITFGAAYGVGEAFCLGACPVTATVPFWGRLIMGEFTACVGLACVGRANPDAMTCGGCEGCNCCRPIFSNLIVTPQIVAVDNELEQVRFLHESHTNLRLVANHARLFAYNSAIRAMRAGQVRMDENAPDVSFLHQ